LACCCTHVIQRASTICGYQAIQRTSVTERQEST
jgi:hypothetical protein